MFLDKTIIVVGAGASKELGLPLGSELVEIISEMLDFRFDFPNKQIGRGDTDILDLFRQRCRDRKIDLNIYLRACSAIKKGISGSMSIDNFLHIHSHNEHIVEVGKTAIAKAILVAERKSDLFININKGHEFSFQNIGKSWILPFYRILSANVTFNDLERIFDRIAIICFNYDRCIEFSLFNCLKLGYEIDDNRAAELMRKLPIIHPYGVTGYLPWQNIGQAIGYGEDNNRAIDIVSKQIRIFTEKEDDKNLSEFIKEHIPNSKKMIFLGYGFYRQNMELIKSYTNQRTKIAATVYGLSDADKSDVDSKLQEAFRWRVKNARDEPITEPPTVILDKLKSKEMIESYQRFLADI